MVGADLVCSAGATSFGAGWEGASAGRGGGNGGDAAVDALEACSGKASSAVIMKKSTNTHARAAGALREPFNPSPVDKREFFEQSRVQGPRATTLGPLSFFLTSLFSAF